MATDPVIDFDALLAEIPGENPAGADLSATGLYAELSELRREDEDGNMGEWELRERKTANWNKLIKVASDTLATKSKDLRVTPFLCEALVRQHGMAGLRDGLRLTRELQEKFWDNFYPPLMPPDGDDDEGGIEVRVAAIGKLDRMLPLPVKFTKVTKHKLGSVPYNHTDWETVRYMEFELKGKMTSDGQDAYALAVAEGKPTGEDFAKAVAGTPRSFYENFAADLDAASEEIKLLNDASQARYAEAEQVPYLSDLAKVMEKFEEMLGEIEKVHGPLRAVAPGETGETGTAGTSPAGPARMIPGEGLPMQPMDREDALQRLRAVAGYFRKAEPHSPVTYLVERAIAWAAMPLDQWLAEIVKDEASLSHIRETLGVRAVVSGS